MADVAHDYAGRPVLVNPTLKRAYYFISYQWMTRDEIEIDARLTWSQSKRVLPRLVQLGFIERRVDPKAGNRAQWRRRIPE